MNEVMTIEQLEALITVSDRRSFSTAAKALKVSKQTISRRIAELEMELGVTLLVRSTRKVAVSDDGREFLQSARQAVEALRDGIHSARARNSEPAGELVVGASVLFAREFLNPVSQRFLLKYPKIRIILLSLDVADTFNLEHLDLAITIGPLPDHSARRIVLGQANSGFFAAPGYLARHRLADTAEPEALYDHLLMACAGRRGLHELTLQRGDESRVLSARPRFESNDVQCILDATIAGVGISHLPLFIGTAAEREGRLVRVLPDWVLVVGPICALYRPTRAPRVGLDTFLELLRQELADRPWEVSGVSGRRNGRSPAKARSRPAQGA